MYNAQKIMEEKGILVPALYSDLHTYAAVLIQRAFRARFINRYRWGRRIERRDMAQRRLWGSVMLKYGGRLQHLDSEHITHDSMFEREFRNIDQYFFKQ